MLIVFFLLKFVQTCNNNGVEGICIHKSYLSKDLKICYEYVSDYICVPYFSVNYNNLANMAR